MFGQLTYLALGSNLNRPHWQLKRAVIALSKLPGCRLHSCSSLYRSAAVGPGAQAHYLNAVIAIRSSLPPLTLLKHCQAIERSQGRRRRKRWGPRTLDIDIACHQKRAVSMPSLHIPHPRLLERDFVLYPLAEIAPEYVLSNGVSAQQAAKAMRQQQAQAPAKITITKLTLHGWKQSG